jgi:hypothetical protein
MSSQQIQQVLNLLALHIKSGKAKRALRLLDSKKPLFEKAGALGVWTYSRGEALVANGQAHKALQEIEGEADPTIRFRVKALALNATCSQTGDWEPLLDHIEQSGAVLSEDEALLELCEIKIRLKDWNYVSDRAQRFCELVGTADAVRLAASATWNAERPVQCLGILDRYVGLFPKNHLPSELARLRIQCLVKTADLLQAQTDAEELLQRDPSVDNIISLINVQLTKMDSTGAMHAARMLRQRDDVTPEQLLTAARLMALDDIHLAREFWRRSKDAALNDSNLAAEALSLAFALGLDHEAGPLLGRIQEFASRGEGPVQVFDIEKMLEIMKERAEHLNRIHGLYQAGEAPLTLVTKQVKRPLADIIHGQSELNRLAKDLYLQPQIYIRHGARLIPPLTAERTYGWRLHLDVTALLLAEELGVLDKVETCFKPLYISAQMSSALRAQRMALAPHQQSQLTSDEIIVRQNTESKLQVLDRETQNQYVEKLRRSLSPVESEVESNLSATLTTSGIPDRGPAPVERPRGENSVFTGNGQEWEKLTEQLREKRLAVIAAAVAENGFAVEFMPLTSYGSDRHPISLPEGVMGHVINCRAVVDALHSRQLMSDETMMQTVQALGTEANPEGYDVVPLVGAKLFLGQGIADVMANAGLLETACEHFLVSTPSESVQEARNNLHEYERRGHTMSWVENVLDRLRIGIEDQTYKAIHIPDDRLRETRETEVSDNYDFMTVLDLMRYEPQPGDVLWVDDRALNKFPTRLGAPLIGINEILLALYLRNEIDKHQYYRLLLRLRAGNFRFIPIDKEEILYHLGQAQVIDGSIEETLALSTLRHYVAACLLDELALQRPPSEDNSPNSMGELPFVLGTTFAIVDAIVITWADETINKEMATARADWMLNNLYTGTLGNRHLLSSEGLEWGRDELYLASTDIATLFSKGINISIDLKRKRESHRRKDYFGWVDDRIAARRFKADPSTVGLVARRLEEIFNGGPHQQYPTKNMEKASRLILQGLFVDLPEVIKSEMRFPPDVMKWLNLELTSVAAVGAVSFPVPEFWAAAEKALREKPAVIKALGTEEEFRFVKGSSDTQTNDWPVVEVLNPSGKRVGEIKDTMLGLLLPDIESRETTLKRHRQMFDLNTDVFQREVEAIASTEDLLERLERARSWIQQSTEVFYHELKRQILDKRTFLWADLMPPSAIGLLRHFRLPESSDLGPSSEVWEQSAGSLLDDQELATVLERYAGLPIAMPSSLVQRLSSEPTKELSGQLKDLSQRWVSPLHQLHLADLALRLATQDGEFLEIGRSVLISLFSEEGAQRFNAFKTILDFVKDEFESWAEVSSWTSGTKLAMVWAHACRLQQIFYETGASAEDLISIFEDKNRPASPETLERDYGMWNDCLHPRRLSRRVFLSHGAAALLGDIDRKVLETAGVIRFIRDSTFEQSELGMRFPSVRLLSDPTRGLNALDSFLGGDRASALGPILGAEEVEALSSESLMKLTEEALNDIMLNQAETGPWAQLFAVLLDLPMYPSLRDRCVSLLRTFDVVQVFKKNPVAARFALHFASNQILHLGLEDLRARYQALLIEIVRLEVDSQEFSPHTETSPKLVKDQPSPRLTNEIAHLMDTGLILSIEPGDASATSRGFGSLLRKLLDVWPDFSSEFGYSMFRLAFELPARQVEGLWGLVLRLRSIRMEAL